MTGALVGDAPGEAADGRRRGVMALGAAAVLAAMVVRTQAMHDPFPWWSADPWLAYTPAVGVLPAMSIVLDVVMACGAMLALIASPARTRAWVPIALALPMVPIAVHVFAADATPDTHRLASAWMGAMLAGVGLAAAAADATLRRVIAAVLVAIPVAVAVKGIGQLVIEHPALMATYESQAEEIVRSRGWAPGSASAASFTRRLTQPDITGWFGLANVAAAALAAALIAMVALLARWREIGNVSRIACVSVGVLLAVTLVLTNSKAGLAAAGLGIGLVLIRSWRRAQVIAVLAALGVPLAVVVARGMVGDRLGELSLLFRWHYLVGSLRVFAQQPWLGISPGEFQAAYSLHKPAVSPEDVASSHSVFLEPMATLGVAAFGWLALIGAWTVGAARNLAGTEDQEHANRMRPEQVRLAGIVAVLVSLVALRLSIDAVSVGTLSVHVVAALAMGGTIVVLLMTPIATAAVLLPAAAVAAVAAAQVDVTAWLPGSAAWFMSLLAVAAVRSGGVPGHDDGSGRRATRACGVLAGVAGAGMVWVLVAAVGPWQRELRRAIEPFGVVHEAMVLMQTGKPAGAARVLGVSPGDVERGLDRARAEAMRRAAEPLDRAAAIVPRHAPTARAMVRRELAMGSSGGDRARAAAERFHVAADSASSSMLMARVVLALDPERSTETVAAAEGYLERAMALTPHAWEPAAQLAEVLWSAGRLGEAAAMAERALEVSARAGLDPLRPAPAATVERLRTIAGGAVGDHSDGNRVGDPAGDP